MYTRAWLWICEGDAGLSAAHLTISIYSIPRLTLSSTNSSSSSSSTSLLGCMRYATCSVSHVFSKFALASSPAPSTPFYVTKLHIIIPHPLR